MNLRSLNERCKRMHMAKIAVLLWISVLFIPGCAPWDTPEEAEQKQKKRQAEQLAEMLAAVAKLKSTEYKVLWSADSADLAKTVTSHLRNGWQLAGGVSAVSPNAGWTVYHQAVFKSPK